MRKLDDKVQRLLLERIAEGGREAALLWIVFSVLDTLITGRLTPLWLAANTGAAFGVWLFAIYTEIRAMKIPRKERS
ncbi:MAG TPA: hypothetical protein VLC46_11385 [Thermoanaerobaculia bacterium]|nr:hypothetical protein [Thermoanaerobaculia bacterium]